MQVRRSPAVGGRVGINASNTLSSRHVVATGNLPDDWPYSVQPTANPGGMVDNKPASGVRPAVALCCTRVDDGAAGLLADPPGNPKSVPAWNRSSRGPKGLVTIRPVPSGQYLAIRPTPRACSQRHRRPSREGVTRSSGASRRPGKLERSRSPRWQQRALYDSLKDITA